MPSRVGGISLAGVLDALGRPGCPACHLRHRAVDRYLEGLLWERVNDPLTRERLRASLGFCHEHAHRLAERPDSLGIALLYQDILSHLTLPERTRTRCPACELADGAVARAVPVLLALAVEGVDGRPADPAVAGRLCYPHFLAVRAKARPGDQAKLDRAFRESVEDLARELEALIRRHDYRFADVPWGSERDAWRRGVAKVAGEPAPGTGAGRDA